MDDLSTAREALSARHTQADTERIVSLIRPLFDNGASFALAPAAEMTGDSVASALRTALADDSVYDWRIIAIGNDAKPMRHAFMTDGEYERYVDRERTSFRDAMTASCDGNIITMLRALLPDGVLMPTGKALPPDLEWRRHHAVAVCVSGSHQPDPQFVQYALLATYFDFALQGDDAWRKRLERLTEIATRKAIPYGPRLAQSGEKPAFLFIGA